MISYKGVKFKFALETAQKIKYVLCKLVRSNKERRQKGTATERIVGNLLKQKQGDRSAIKLLGN